ncbi:hypothetical protein LCGC14_0386950 [marine sediment metagenome]|uniref:Uncharacterized protein n=1 Tax=marine sediment metagenome TaxID=412755 RepID=A0A0F9TIV0_9ZZZZ
MTEEELQEYVLEQETFTAAGMLYSGKAVQCARKCRDHGIEQADVMHLLEVLKLPAHQLAYFKDDFLRAMSHIETELV